MRNVVKFSFFTTRIGRLGWGNAEKVLRETPPSCSNLPTKSFPFSEKVFMPGSLQGNLASLIFRPGYGQYGVVVTKSEDIADGWIGRDCHFGGDSFCLSFWGRHYTMTGIFGEFLSVILGETLHIRRNAAFPKCSP